MNIIKVRIGPYGVPADVCLIKETTKRMLLGWIETGTRNIIFRHWYNKDIIEVLV